MRRKIISIIAIMSIFVLAIAGCGKIDESEKIISVTCVDEDGNPLEGAIIQFCDNSRCTTATSDSNGIATMYPADGLLFNVHVYKTPLGYYTVNDEEYDVVPGQTDVTFIFRQDENYAKLDLEAINEAFSDNSENNSDDVNTKNNEFDDSAFEGLKAPIVTDTVVNFNSVDIDGNPVDESIFKGHKITVINFWEEWCSWCLEEMPGLEALYEKYGDEGLQIIGVYTVDSNNKDVEYDPSDPERVKEVVDDLGITYPVIEYSSDFNKLRLMGVPSSFIVDEEGRVLRFEDRDIFNLMATSLIEFDYNYYKEYFIDDKDAYEQLSDGQKDYLDTYMHYYEEDIDILVDGHYEDFLDSEFAKRGLIDGFYPDGSWEAIVRYYINNIK